MMPKMSGRSSKGPGIDVIPAVGYGLKITFADREKPHAAANDIIKADPCGTYWKGTFTIHLPVEFL